MNAKIDKTYAKLIKGSKNYELLLSFAVYCLANKNERFYQCLSNWSNTPILTADIDPKTGDYKNIRDTFYLEK